MTATDSEPRVPAAERRGTERRSGMERRLAIIPIVVERRRAMDRRAADRRLSGLTSRQQLSAALDLLARVAEEGELDEPGLRVLDGAVLRVRAALDRLDR
jgi:hypothetical protein